MTVSEVVQIITAAATCITAIGGLIIAIRTGVVKKAVQETHVMVNQQRTDMMKYQENLIGALQTAGVEIPKDRSLKSKVSTKEPAEE